MPLNFTPFDPTFLTSSGDTNSLYARMPNGDTRRVTDDGSGGRVVESVPVVAGSTTLTVWVQPPRVTVSPILLFQSPIEGDTSAYPQPLGSIIGPPGMLVRKTFTLRPDTRSVWWQSYGWYYDQTQGGTWVYGLPDRVGTPAWPRGLGAPVKVNIISGGA